MHLTANISEVYSQINNSINFAWRSLADKQNEIDRAWQIAGEHKEVFYIPPSDFGAPIVVPPTKKRRIGFI